jgi:tetratricopeptide (TPR) repeat protein
MKKIYSQTFKVAILCVLSLWLTSCNDFLKQDPQSDYSASTFYQTQSDFQYAIAGVYSAQQGLYNGLTYFRIMILRGDEVDLSSRLSSGYDDNASLFTDGDSGNYLLGAWEALWTMIYRCNAILDRIDAASFTDANVQKYIKGEALALRAWSYYTLAVSFGGMPLIDKVTSVNDTKNVKRSTQEETLAFAAADYKSAIDLLPESWSGSSLGRVTKYAALGGLARIYMFQSKFAEADTYLKQIISSQKYTFETSYVNCFNEANENKNERVWEVQFNTGGTGVGQGFSGSFLPESATVGKDILPVGSGASARLQLAPEFLAAFEAGDARKSVETIGNIAVNGTLTGYTYIRKWMYYSNVPINTNDWGINLPILRYTDVLMMHAECLNEASYVADGEAFNIINQVRGRAGLAKLTSATVTSQAAFRTALQKERRIEFAFEGLRWFDLVRWGQAKDTINDFFKNADEGGGTYSFGTDNHRLIFAIPSEEINRYANTSIMWQNDGY